MNRSGDGFVHPNVPPNKDACKTSAGVTLQTTQLPQLSSNPPLASSLSEPLHREDEERSVGEDAAANDIHSDEEGMDRSVLREVGGDKRPAVMCTASCDNQERGGDATLRVTAECKRGGVQDVWRDIGVDAVTRGVGFPHPAPEGAGRRLTGVRAGVEGTDEGAEGKHDTLKEFDGERLEPPNLHGSGAAPIAGLDREVAIELVRGVCLVGTPRTRDGVLWDAS